MHPGSGAASCRGSGCRLNQRLSTQHSSHSGDGGLCRAVEDKAGRLVQSQQAGLACKPCRSTPAAQIAGHCLLPNGRLVSGSVLRLWPRQPRCTAAAGQG